MSDSASRRARSKAKYNACTVEEWFPTLEAQCKARGANPYEEFRAYVDSGLLLHAAEPGYVHHEAPIHKGDVSVAICKARLARRIIEAGVANDAAPDALVPVYWRTPHEFQLSLFDLWVVRSNLKRVCQSLGKQDVPWPDEEIGFELQLQIGDLQIERDRIADMSAKNISEESEKRRLLKEIDSEIAELQAEFDRVLPADEAVGTNRRNIARAEKDCKSWLVEHMRNAPKKPKRDYTSEAIHKFAGLSVRGFDRAWGNAINESETTLWSKPGRKSGNL